MTARRGTPSSKKRLCDDLWRDIIRAPQRCARCGSTDGPFEAAHVIRRRYAHTRTDELNGWCLDSKCHRIIDTYTSEFFALVEQTIGLDAHHELEVKSMNRAKKDWFQEHDRLKALVKARTP